MVGGDDWRTLSVHSYPVRALAGDYLRTSVGLFLTAGPLLLVELIDSLRIILFLLSMVFLIFGVRAIIRQMTTVMLCDKGIVTVSRLVPTKAISWHTVRQMTLKYFTTRRDREAGWMQLRLTDTDGRLALDSAIDGFDQIVARATECADTNGLLLSVTTRENLAAMGLADTGSDLTAAADNRGVTG
jgi:hypothetical protein